MSIGRALVQAGLLGALLPEGAAALPPGSEPPVTIGRIARDQSLRTAFELDPAAALREMGFDPAAWDLASPLPPAPNVAAATGEAGDLGAIQMAVDGPPPGPPVPQPIPTARPTSPPETGTLHKAPSRTHPRPAPSPTATPTPPMPVYGPPPGPGSRQP